MKELTTRQARILLMYSVFISKVVILPSLLTNGVDRNCWIVMLILFCVDFIFIYLLLKINKKDINTTLKEKMQKIFGKAFTSAFYILIGIILLIKLTVSLHEIFVFFYDVLYVNLAWITVLIPMFIYICYIAKRRLRNLGRSLEIYGFLILVCVFIAIFDGLKSMQFTRLLPLFTGNTINILNVSFNYTLWFGDFLYLFFILGNVRAEKDFDKKMIKTWLIGVGISLVVLIAFYGDFGNVAPLKRVAIIDMTQHTPRLNSSSSFVWLATFLWAIGGIFEIGFLSFLTSESFALSLNLKDNKKLYVIIGMLVLVLFILVLTSFRLIQLLNFITLYFKYYIFAVQYVFVLVVSLIMFFSMKQRRKRYA